MIVYDAFLDSGSRPDLRPLGFRRDLHLLYATRADLEGGLLARHAPACRGKLTMVENEHLKLDARQADDATLERNADAVARALDGLRAADPTIRLGLFSHLPLDPWYKTAALLGPSHERWRGWELANARLRKSRDAAGRWRADGLASHVDVVFPAFYVSPESGRTGTPVTLEGTLLHFDAINEAALAFEKPRVGVWTPYLGPKPASGGWATHPAEWVPHIFDAFRRYGLEAVAAWGPWDERSDWWAALRESASK